MTSTNKLCVNVIASGYTQTRGTYHGLLKLREELILDGHNGINSRVWYCPWTASYKDVAEDLQTICVKHGLVPVVNAAGYSYGGWWVLRFCEELMTRGIRVPALTLCDPVARPRWWPRPLPAATSMLSRNYSPRLTVPENVDDVYELWQSDVRPMGHRLRVSERTEVKLSQQLFKPHVRMDDDELFHECVKQRARELCEG